MPSGGARPGAGRKTDAERAARLADDAFQGRLEETLRRIKANPKAGPIACRLHYIDLLRAGHVPGQGELNIASDGSLHSTVHRPPIHSSTGSSALTCAEA